jgi:hypothetical protein
MADRIDKLVLIRDYGAAEAQVLEERILDDNRVLILVQVILDELIFWFHLRRVREGYQGVYLIEDVPELTVIDEQSPVHDEVLSFVQIGKLENSIAWPVETCLPPRRISKVCLLIEGRLSNTAFDEPGAVFLDLTACLGVVIQT